MLTEKHKYEIIEFLNEWYGGDWYYSEENKNFQCWFTNLYFTEARAYFLTYGEDLV